jgi:methanol metabolism-related c-type cytochrome
MCLAEPWLGALLVAGIAAVSAAHADNIAAASEEDGKFMTDEGVPTFNVTEDGNVDWATFSGYRRYHSECHVCHGPDGQGSSYAPALAKSAVTLDYYDFVDIVVNGRTNGTNVMPSFGTNLNVMCYLDDIYVYLKAVGSDAIPRGRPAKRADKPESYAEAENACMGG